MVISTYIVMRAFEVQNYINAQVSRASEVFMGLH